MSRSVLVFALFPLCFASAAQAAGSNSKSLEDLLRSITARQVYTTTDEPGTIVDAVAAERARGGQSSQQPSQQPRVTPAATARAVTAMPRNTSRDDIAATVDAVAREYPGTATNPGSRHATVASARPAKSHDTDVRDVVSILNPGHHAAQTRQQPIVDLDGESVAPLNAKKAPKGGATFAAVIPDRAKSQAGVYTYGPVRGGITLSEVATNLLPSAEVTVAQMMWALYQKNKQAFANGNIARLKANSTLNVPHLDEVLAISRTAAEAALARMRTAPDRTASAKLNTAL
jgi:FimV-like protein